MTSYRSHPVQLLHLHGFSRQFTSPVTPASLRPMGAPGKILIYFLETSVNRKPNSRTRRIVISWTVGVKRAVSSAPAGPRFERLADVRDRPDRDCDVPPDGFGGVGLHHQGPGLAGRGRPASEWSYVSPPIRPPKVDPAQRRVNGSSPRRHGRRSQARRPLLPRCRWRSPRPGSRTSTPTSAASRAAHAASPPR